MAWLACIYHTPGCDRCEAVLLDEDEGHVLLGRPELPRWLADRAIANGWLLAPETLCPDCAPAEVTAITERIENEMAAIAQRIHIDQTHTPLPLEDNQR